MIKREAEKMVEKKAEKTSKKFWKNEKDDYLCSRKKTKTSSLKLLGKEKERKPKRVSEKVSKDW